MDSGKNGTEGQLNARDIEEMSKRVQEAAETEDGKGGRKLTGWQHKFVYICSIFFVAFQIYAAIFGNLSTLIQRAIHMEFAIVIIYATTGLKKKKASKSIAITDWILMMLGIITMAAVVVKYDYIMSKPIFWAMPMLVLGLIALLVCMEACRRTLGLVFPILIAIFMVYAFGGAYFPGDLWHKGCSFEKVFSMIYLGTSGMFGSTVGLSAGTIAIFTIFGCLLLFSGAGDTFFKLSLWIAGRFTGGAAKVAVVASGLFGMINGSAASNVATTGILTIPLMKKSGYTPEFAAGAAAVGAVGGQIMPPIMGTGAFVMAEFLGLPYRTVALLAIAPAVIFYMGLFLGVHLESKKNHITTGVAIPDKKEFMHLGKMLNLLFPIIILIVMFMVGFSTNRSGIYAILATVLLPVFTEIIPGKMKIREFLSQLGRGCQSAAATMASIAVLVTCADVVCGLISMTGISVKLSNFIIALSGNSALLALVLAAIVVIILGMGLPTTAAYVLGAAVMASALIGMGIGTVEAHFFIFFYSILGNITPPVCAAVLIGSGIADSNWVRTARHAIMLGIAAYILPFSWVYNPQILFQSGTIVESVIAIGSAVLSVILLAFAMKGRMRTELGLPVRVALGILSVGCLAKIGFVTVVCWIAAAVLCFGHMKACKAVCE